jgi:hypothetical protein
MPLLKLNIKIWHFMCGRIVFPRYVLFLYVTRGSTACTPSPVITYNIEKIQIVISRSFLSEHFWWKRCHLMAERLLLVDLLTGRISTTCNPFAGPPILAPTLLQFYYIEKHGNFKKRTWCLLLKYCNSGSFLYRRVCNTQNVKWHTFQFKKKNMYGVPCCVFAVQ